MKRLSSIVFYTLVAEYILMLAAESSYNLWRKKLPAIRDTCVQSLDLEDPLEKQTATHISILAWRIPWTVQSTELQRVGHD